MTTINFRAFPSLSKRNPVPIGSHSPFCPPLHLSSPREAPVSSLSLWICHSGHFTSMKQATGGFLWLAFFLLSIVFSRFVPVVAPSMGFSRQEYRSGVPLPSPVACISNFLNFFCQGQASGRAELHTHT